MLKHKNPIFKNTENWRRLRHSAIFRSEEQMSRYHKSVLADFPSRASDSSAIILKTSGSTNNFPKNYRFPAKLFSLIDNHHMWRIFDSHGIASGNSVRIFQAHGVATNALKGPFLSSGMGLNNRCWELVFNPSCVDGQFWKGILKKLNSISPVFLYTTPSVFVSIKDYIEKPMNFPVVFSCETLTDRVRTDADSLFTKVIDKMYDWTTGFGFYECKEGNRHVYDELCLWRPQEGGKIYVKNLFNHFDSSWKISDDTATIKKGFCRCGVYGGIIESFEGKNFECLVSVQGTKYAANYVSNSMMALHKLGINIYNYQIIQDKNKNVVLKTQTHLSEEQALSVAGALNYMLMDHQKKQDLSSADNANIFKDGVPVYLSHKENPSISVERASAFLNSNKKISLRSYAVS